MAIERGAESIDRLAGIRALFKAALGDSLGLAAAFLEAQVFPGSHTVPRLEQFQVAWNRSRFFSLTAADPKVRACAGAPDYRRAPRVPTGAT